MNNQELLKQAGILDDAISLLSGAASSMYDEIKTRIEKDGAYAILWYLAPAVLGVFWGPLGWGAWAVEVVMEVFDINLTDIFGKARTATKEALDSGEPISEEKVDDIVDYAIGGEEEAVSTASMADILRKSGIIKEAGLFGSFFRWFLRRAGAQVGWRMTGKGLFVAMLKWTLKKILMGVVGVTAISTAVEKVKGTSSGRPGEAGTEVPVVTKQRTEELKVARVPTPDKSKIAQYLTPTGVGTTAFINSSSRRWVVPLINANIASTMIYWAINVYEEIEQDDSPIILNSNAFKQMVRVLLTNYDRQYPNYLEMPNNQQLSSPINSIKDVVDYFIWEVAEQIGKQKNA